MRPMTIRTILILFITSSAWSQTPIQGTTSITSEGVISDTINLSPNRDFEKRINLGPIDSSRYDFEIRFYKLTSVTGKRNLRLVRLVGGRWESFEFDENKKAKIIKHLVVPTIGYDTFIMTLMKCNYTSLPNQSDLDKKIQNSFATKKEYLQSRPAVMDGNKYTVEFKIGDKFRVYQFQNAEIYARYYDNVEWKNYISIQNLFEKELVRK